MRGMAPSSSSRVGRPPRTSREAILAAARGLIAREGWQRLTFRRLAAELGVGTTTLYHHVRDREDLVIQLLNDQAARTARPELPGDPHERIIAAGIAVHDTLARWPWAAEVVATDGFIVRLGEPALWMVDAIVGGALDAGCTQAEAVVVFRSVWYYTVGEIIVRARTADRPSDAPRAVDADSFTGLDPERLPHLAAVRGEWGRESARDTYAEGLRAFVGGLLDRGRVR